MAKILKFRNKYGSSSGHDFLTDETQKLAFRKNKDGDINLGQMMQNNLSGLFLDPKKDWSNQELADMFRVQQILSNANMPVETDRGITDEGDPWFVFCHACGEVFIHLCRIEGTYVLDCPNVTRPLRGVDFAELIADFTNKALPSEAGETERRVIRLERGSKVRLHPSAMLAALIWTLFLTSEELVLMPPDTADTPLADDDSLLEFDGMFVVNAADTAIEGFLIEQNISDFDVASLIKENTLDADQEASEAHAQMRESLVQQQGLAVHNNAFTMGLSTVAIAMGFMSETVLLDNQSKVLETLRELGFSEYGVSTNKVSEIEIRADEADAALLVMLTDFLGLGLSLNPEQAQIATAEDAPLGQDLDELMSVNVLTAASIQISENSVDTPPLTLVTDTSPEAFSLTFAEGELTFESGSETFQGLYEIVQVSQSQMEEYQVGKNVVKASFDVSGADAFALFDLLDASLATSQRSTSFQEFDDMAQRLIDFITSKDGDLGVIESDNQIIMVDHTAVVGGEIDYIHWETEDGTIISLVGLASDFQQFDMIA